jgi:hypothetical protein
MSGEAPGGYQSAVQESDSFTAGNKAARIPLHYCTDNRAGKPVFSDTRSGTSTPGQGHQRSRGQQLRVPDLPEEAVAARQGEEPTLGRNSQMLSM